MAKRNKRAEEKVEREVNPKEIRLRARRRERDRVLYLGVGTAIGLALLLIIAGAIYQFAYVPNSTVATVAGERIIAKDYWERLRLERSQLQSQMINMQQLQEQFGQQFFATQINQIQAQLQSPFALGATVLDKMIDERIVNEEASALGVAVTDEEVDAALREEIASGRNTITEPQATSTAEAAVNATATATLWTPTPTPTIDANLAVTATAAPLPTTEPLPTSVILSATGYTEGVTQLEETLATLNTVDLANYREVIRSRLLADKVAEIVSTETVTTTEEQVRARHILIQVVTPTVGITDTGTITAPILPSNAVTETALTTATAATAATATVSDTVSEPVTNTQTVTSTALTTMTSAVTTTSDVTATAAVTAAADMTTTAELSTSVAVTTTANTTANITGTIAPTDSTSLTDTIAAVPPALVERTDAEARALAEEIRQRLLAGEDFATLAQEYSSDTSSTTAGGDLGWFGRGSMVAPFEEAAFSLPIGEISEPIRSDFGYHIIEVLEKDANRPKDPSALEQERQQAYQTWLQEKKTATAIERPDDLTALFPRDLQ